MTEEPASEQGDLMDNQPTDIFSIIERLDNLESQNKMFKNALIIALVAICLLLLMGQVISGRSIIESGQYIVTDSSGTVRAKLEVLPDHTAQFVFSDRQGQPTLSLQVSPEGKPVFSFAENNETIRVQFGFDDRNVPSVIIYSDGSRKEWTLESLESTP